MELEPSFFRLHVRLLDTYATAFGTRGRRILEYAALLSFCVLTVTLVHLHSGFIGTDTCIQKLLVQNDLFSGAHVIRLEVLSPLQGI